MIVHKLSYIPYTGLHVLCGFEETWKRYKADQSWQKVTCKRCLKLRKRVFWPS